MLCQPCNLDHRLLKSMVLKGTIIWEWCLMSFIIHHSGKPEVKYTLTLGKICLLKHKPCHSTGSCQTQKSHHRATSVNIAITTVTKVPSSHQAIRLNKSSTIHSKLNSLHSALNEQNWKNWANMSRQFMSSFVCCYFNSILHLYLTSGTTRSNPARGGTSLSAFHSRRAR